MKTVVLIALAIAGLNIQTTKHNPYHDIDWASEFNKLDNKLDSMDMTINELIIYEINDTITKNK